MWPAGDFRQRMIARTASISALVLMLFASSACTPIPPEYRQSIAQPAARVSSQSETHGDGQLLALVGAARIGASQLHVDPESGLTSTIKVSSEYFSANGRSCRRFSQHSSNSATPEIKLACKSHSGWQEIPLASIVE